MHKYVFTRVLIKIKVFHSCRNFVVHFALVFFTLVFYSCVLVLLMLHRCCNSVARVALALLMSATGVVKYIRFYLNVNEGNYIAETTWIPIKNINEWADILKSKIATCNIRVIVHYMIKVRRTSATELATNN